MVTIRVILISLVMSTSVMAADIRSSRNWEGTEMWLGLGLLKGRSGEYVYDADGSYLGVAGHKVSELDWMLDNVPMAGVGFTVSMSEQTRFSLGYWLNAADGDGTMDDYDWLYIGYDWTDWSHHSDTTVRKAELFDVNGEYTFSKESKRREKSSWSGVFGYRRDFFEWQARGGYGIYSSAPPNYRDLFVIFADVPGITYQQTFTTPYLGLQYRTSSRSRGGGYRTRFGMYYSAWAEGEDVDIHHLRDLRFEEKGNGGEWYKFEIEMVFDISRNITYSLGYSTQTYEEIKASTTVTDLTSGATAFYPGDAAGLSHKSELLTMSLQYRF